MTNLTPTNKQLWAYRIGRLLQLLGLIVGLEALLVFGAEPSEGPMIYTTIAAVALFYLGYWLIKRFGPPRPASHQTK